MTNAGDEREGSHLEVGVQGAKASQVRLHGKGARDGPSQHGCPQAPVLILHHCKSLQPSRNPNPAQRNYAQRKRSSEVVFWTKRSRHIDLVCNQQRVEHTHVRLSAFNNDVGSTHVSACKRQKQKLIGMVSWRERS